MTQCTAINFKSLSNIALMPNVQEPDSQDEGLKKNIGFKEGGRKKLLPWGSCELVSHATKEKEQKKKLYIAQQFGAING